MKKTILTLLACVASISVIAAEEVKNETAQKNLKPYAAELGELQRHIIILPKLENESVIKVELIPAKMMITDGINRYSLGLSLEKGTVKGWGYSYYKAVGNDQAMSTRMGGQADPKERLVMGRSMLVRYNSKLPLVVYLPKGCELHYRIWTADKQTKKAAQK